MPAYFIEMQKVLTIAGMHRSGTSLTAMWLQGCGLELGNNLMTGEFDNPLGHFEDLDILYIHQNDLKRKGLKTHGLNLKGATRFNFESESKFEAEQFFEKNRKLDNWGWKEPRSTLYLNEWKTLIPELKVLAVFRPYHEVVNSLVKRTKHSFQKTKKYGRLNRLAHLSLFPLYLYVERKRYLDAWISYNQSILEFKKNYPDDILIVELDDLISNDQTVLQSLIDRFMLNLKMKSINLFYDKKLLSNNTQKVNVGNSKKERIALKIQYQLRELSTIRS